MTAPTALRGNVDTLRKLRESLADAPLSVAIQVAQDVAPAITTEAQTAFDAGVTVYGEPRPVSLVDGEKLDLVQSGAVRRDMRFQAVGSVVRAVLGPRYAKYLIGRYKILPVGDRSKVPVRWRAIIDAAFQKRMRERLAGAGVK
jgi:hypothetical protein